MLYNSLDFRGKEDTWETLASLCQLKIHRSWPEACSGSTTPVPLTSATFPLFQDTSAGSSSQVRRLGKGS